MAAVAAKAVARSTTLGRAAGAAPKMAAPAVVAVTAAAEVAVGVVVGAVGAGAAGGAADAALPAGSRANRTRPRPGGGLPPPPRARTTSRVAAAAVDAVRGLLPRPKPEPLGSSRRRGAPPRGRPRAGVFPSPDGAAGSRAWPAACPP